MRLATEVNIFVGLLRTAVILLGLGSVVLFDRMSPAIEQILAENVVTLVAVEDMLTAMAQTGRSPEETAAEFEEALERAQRNLTEAAERPLLEEIQATWRRSLRFDASSGERAELLMHIQNLSAVNRRKMRLADEEADRLGAAGAWSAVLLSLVILALSQFLNNRLDARVVQRLATLQDVVEAAQSGDIHRRMPDGGPDEIRHISTGLNRLLDLAGSWRTASPDRLAPERVLLEHLLRERPGAWAVIDDRRSVRAANPQARRILKGATVIARDAPFRAEEAVEAGGLRLIQIDTSVER